MAHVGQVVVGLGVGPPVACHAEVVVFVAAGCDAVFVHDAGGLFVHDFVGSAYEGGLCLLHGGVVAGFDVVQSAHVEHDALCGGGK